ncbi:MAG: hypothetical protein ACREF7_02890 [Candidatus Saccharimonadales bacterium]
MEMDFEVKYAPGAVLKSIQEVPEAAELALDELRRNPMSGIDGSQLSEIGQKHGTDVLEYYSFFFEVINAKEAFFEIDFDERVDDAVAADTTQSYVEEELSVQFRNGTGDADITPEMVISRSKRANMLRVVAKLAIEDKLKTQAAKPKATKPIKQHEESRLALPKLA